MLDLKQRENLRFKEKNVSNSLIKLLLTFFLICCKIRYELTYTQMKRGEVYEPSMERNL
ncbi:hypothetical protein Bcell_0580 [Evansella cellulosilytica DSM 2522]|uniref:Uncharacterized protein n=1 Tax=Evansella cellulosilytica (strain ATCC 21833 / DSM 2522 / FERM P-1141 / JCM 9156 / N-4) TaxID=649639 RepID=E6TYC4_EVAC2|nr:hypothetical protein Bcell_0580 [Evansella cellulosilytica DSM 2522]